MDFEIRVDWRAKKTASGASHFWCGFPQYNFDPVGRKARGIYTIWNREGRAVYVGQGMIADRIGEHRRSDRIAEQKPVWSTWTRTPSESQL